MNPRLRHPIRYHRIRRLMRIARAVAIEAGHLAGTCVEFSPRGFICTLHEPHREHVAHSDDGREVDRLISRADQPA